MPSIGQRTSSRPSLQGIAVFSRRGHSQYAAAVSRFQRDRDAGEEQRATTLELFYDLVFVFAITQVSHLLLDDLSWAGAGKALLALLVVWWAWNYTTWVTNELDPDSIVVRLLLIAIMLASLLMAVAIPEAFGEHALLFAGSYVAIQVGRHVPHLRYLRTPERSNASARANPRMVRRLRRAVDRRCVRRRLGEGGALAGGARDRLRWPDRALLDSRPSALERRDLGGGDLALRRALPAVHDHRPRRDDRDHGRDHGRARARRPRLVAFGLAFLGTAALWWLYFDYVASTRTDASRGTRTGRGSRATRTPTSTPRSSRESSSPRSATSS